MVSAGNHEVEWLSNATSLETQVFMSYEKRFRMPQVAPAVITSAPNPLTYSADNKLCAPSKYQAGYEYGNSYFSYAAGPVLFIHLNPYSYTNTSSIQYGWLLKTLQCVDRKITPWVVVSACLRAPIAPANLASHRLFPSSLPFSQAVFHNPWYNSNTEHQNEFETLDMQAAMEPLFTEYQVTLVLNGHGE